GREPSGPRHENRQGVEKELAEAGRADAAKLFCRHDLPLVVLIACPAAAAVDVALLVSLDFEMHFLALLGLTFQLKGRCWDGFAGGVVINGFPTAALRANEAARLFAAFARVEDDKFLELHARVVNAEEEHLL